MTINPIQFSKFELPYNKVLARLGYASGKTKIDNKISDILNEVIETAQKLFVPKKVISTSRIKFSGPGTVVLDPSLTIESADIRNLLMDCAEAAGFAVTIGPALESMRDGYLKDKETARALMLDAVGSVAAEELADITNRQITDEYLARGLVPTRRFSPGYGDWALSGQKSFLEWLGAPQIGLRLSDTFEMIPEKSVSAIIGLKQPRKEDKENNG